MSMMTRREALNLTSALAVGLAFPVRAQTRRPKKVVIAGAGIGGLCCGYELMKRGHDVTLLEAAGRTGGHVYTVRDRLADDFYADAGAEHVTKPGYDLYWQYVKEFDLPTLFYPRRRNLLRFLGGKLCTEEMLADRSVLGVSASTKGKSTFSAVTPGRSFRCFITLLIWMALRTSTVRSMPG